ncbi:MAG: bifunctional metallophosphatase/5'-nucleotidase [Candidatus Eisenbacteria bacterium]|nr:bifunctional metallophosphatase/5'-nucleotidase [Candidatus Eisenbacteria bacterium]
MRTSFLLLALAAAAVFTAPAGAGKAAQLPPGQVQIDILYTSDLHGHIDTQAATFMNPQFPPSLGGGASAATYIEKVRAEAKAAGRGFLLLDSGDMFQGTPVGMHTQGKAIVEWMNKMGYSAATIGNHDFDIGWDKAKEMVDLATFPVLCANLFDTATNKRVDWVKDRVMLDVAGLKVAIIGMITEATARISFSKNVQGLTFLPVGEMLPAMVKAARDDGAQIVLLPVHAGLPYKASLATYYREMVAAEQRGERPKTLEAMEIARYVPGIDIVFAGHSHQGYDVPWEDPINHTLVVEPYANGSSLGHITVTHDKDAGTIVGYDTHHDRGALVTLYEDEFWPDQGVAEGINLQVAEAEQGLDEILGETRVNLERGSAEKGLMGALVTDAIREQAGTDVAIQNTGGVRADIAPGRITKRECLSVLPFDNAVVSVSMKGEVLRRLFEQKVSRWALGLFISGATAKYDPTRPAGQRIVSIEVGGAPLDTAKTYTVAMTNFLAEGNSGLTVMREVPEDSVYQTRYSDRESLENYFRRHSPVARRSESRWVKVDEPLTPSP